MNRLRILHTESSLGWGGQEIRILTEAAGMIARGHAVTILSCPESNIDRAARRAGIPTAAVPIEKKRPANLLALRSWLTRHGGEFDVINTHSSTDAWLVALAGATLRQTPPAVRTRHVSTRIGNRITTRWLYLRATRHIVTTGERLRRQLHDDNGFPLDHMTSVPTGIDLARYRPGDARAARTGLGLQDRPTLGIVATLRSWKGHADLLAAWSQLGAQRSGWQVVIVGDGPQRSNIEAQVDALGLAGDVHLAGNREDVERWLPAFDLFVLPSYGNEGVPQGIMQAMAAGLPVVSTTVGAIAEAVIDGETGILVPPRDLPAIGGALARLVGDAALRRRLGDAGCARAQAHFGAGHMLDRMEAVFRSAIGSAS
jgi:glycosyltransferase involved in cell wall biosynthesis